MQVAQPAQGPLFLKPQIMQIDADSGKTEPWNHGSHGILGKVNGKPSTAVLAALLLDRRSDVCAFRDFRGFQVLENLARHWRSNERPGRSDPTRGNLRKLRFLELQAQAWLIHVRNREFE